MRRILSSAICLIFFCWYLKLFTGYTGLFPYDLFSFKISTNIHNTHTPTFDTQKNFLLHNMYVLERFVEKRINCIHGKFYNIDYGLKKQTLKCKKKSEILILLLFSPYKDCICNKHVTKIILNKMIIIHE